MPSRAKAAAQMPPIDPSVLFVTIPPLIILSVYLVRKWYLARRLRLYGIGKGAPGFKTNVARIRVTPEIKERLARGENVSPDEIAAASAKMDELEAKARRNGTAKPKQEQKKSGGGGLLAGRGVVEEIQLGSTAPASSASTKEPEAKTEPVNEWLPENLTTPKKRPGKGKRK